MAGQDAVSTLLADKIKIVVPMNQSLFGMTAHLPRRLLSHAPRNDETRRAQVHGDHAEVVIHGKVNQVSARLPRPLLFALCGPCSLRRAGR